MKLTWKHDQHDIDWDALSHLYKIAPLGNKSPAGLQTTYGNSMYKCFVYQDGQVIGAGRALADGLDCSYLCDVVVHPEHQGRGIGKEIISRLVGLSKDHKKIILYANPGKEGFYRKLGFYPMNTAMAIFRDPQKAIEAGLTREA